MNSIGWTEKQSLQFLFPFIISISFAMDVFVPAIPSMSRFFTIDDSLMQASLYLFMLTVSLGQICVGPLAERFGRRRIGIVSCLLFFIGSFASALSPSIYLFLLARMLQAAGACGTYLLCFIIIRDNFSTTSCARLFSILCGINSMVASSAPIIGGFLLDFTLRWQSGFYFLAGLGVCMCFVSLRNIPHYAYSKPSTSARQTMQFILNHREFRQYTLIASVSLLGLYLFCALSPGILISQLALSPTAYGLWFGLNAMTVFISNLISAKLSYTRPLEKLVRWGVLWMMFSCISMMMINFIQLTVWGFMLPMLSLTFGIGLSMGNATALALKEFQQQAGTATALLGASQFGLAGLMGIMTAQWQSSPLLLAFPVLSLCILSFMNMKKSVWKLSPTI